MIVGLCYYLLKVHIVWLQVQEKNVLIAMEKERNNGIDPMTSH